MTRKVAREFEASLMRTALSPRQKARELILIRIKRNSGKELLTDVARMPGLRGVNFRHIEEAAKDLVKEGRARMDREGNIEDIPGAGKKMAEKLLKEVASKFTSKYKFLETDIQDEGYATELLMADKYDEPHYASSLNIAVDHDNGEVDLQIIWPGESTAITLRTTNPNKVFQEAEKFLKKESDMLNKTDKTAKVHPNERSRQEYLKKHPKANPANHTVKDTAPSSKPGSKPKKKDAPKEKPKGENDDLPSDIQRMLKKLSPEKKKEVLNKALVNNKAEGDKPTKQKDVSKQDGMDALKGLSPAAQKRVLERALKMAKVWDSEQAMALEPKKAADAFKKSVAKQAAESFRASLKD